MVHLVHATDDSPGIRRRRGGQGFTYEGPDGRPLSARERERVEALKVPPAWTDVWICGDGRGHIQATGYDEKRRKQYLYHDAWREAQDQQKFERLARFGRRLPRLRQKVRRDLRRPGLPREKVLAAVIRVMERAFVRVGGRRYAKENGSYGATTLEDRHVEAVSGSEVHLRFQGKGGKAHEIDLDDPRLAAVVRRCQELPGQHLFGYQEGTGQVVDVYSDDVNDYLHEALGDGFSSKELRTWSANALLVDKLLHPPVPDGPAREARYREAVKDVAEELNNTPAVCRQSYIHPVIEDAFLEGRLAEEQGPEEVLDLRIEERLLLQLLPSS